MQISGVAWCVTNSLLYVGLLYIWRGGLPRDHPSTIKRRLVSVVLACAVSWVPVYLQAKQQHLATPVLQLLGLRWEGSALGALHALYSIATLFAGPLLYFVYESDFDGMLRGDGSSITGRLGARVCDLRLWRNLVFAPLSEEWVFRACMAPLLIMQGFSNQATVLITPLFFGAAHLHHLVDLTTHQHVALAQALLMVAFQFAYTTLFGWIATYLFLRTGTLAAPVAAHVFCNWAGFPPFQGMAQHQRVVQLVLTTVFGALAFISVTRRFTEPELFGQTWFEWPLAPVRDVAAATAP